MAYASSSVYMHVRAQYAIQTGAIQSSYFYGCSTWCYIFMGCYNNTLSARLTLGHYKSVGCYNQGGVTIQRLRYAMQCAYHLFCCIYALISLSCLEIPPSGIVCIVVSPIFPSNLSSSIQTNWPLCLCTWNSYIQLCA